MLLICCSPKQAPSTSWIAAISTSRAFRSCIRPAPFSSRGQSQTSMRTASTRPDRSSGRHHRRPDYRVGWFFHPYGLSSSSAPNSVQGCREWQNGAAALAISSRRPTGWLGSRMIRSMYTSGSSPVAAASCRTCSFARLAAPLGRPAPGRFPPCPFIVLSRGDRKPRAVSFGIRFTCTTIRYSSPARRSTDFVIERGGSTLRAAPLKFAHNYNRSPWLLVPVTNCRGGAWTSPGCSSSSWGCSPSW